MACTITITSVMGIPSGPNTTVNVSGTVVGCTGNQVNIVVTCGMTSYSEVVPVAGGQITWSGNVVTQCTCAGPITVVASCPSAGCSTTTTLTNLPCCCPTLAITSTESAVCVTMPNCANGGRMITHNITGTLPSGCPTSTVQINYGDSSLSQIYNVTGPSFNIIDTHVYCAGSTYLGVVYSPGSPGCQGTPFSVTPTACPDCKTNTVTRLACDLLEFAFLVTSVIGFTCIAVPGCGSALFTAIVAVALTAILYNAYTSNATLGCTKCECFPYLKWLGIATLATGLCLLGFLFSPCATLSPLIPIGLIAAGALVIQIWYSTYSILCPLTICHFWAAIRLAGLVALGAFAAVYVAITAALIIAPGPAIAIASMIVVISIATIAINSNQNNGNCVNYP